MVGGGAVQATGAGTLQLTALRLGENVGTPTSGSLTLSANTIASGVVTEAAPGLGAVTVSPVANLSVPASSTLTLGAKLQNDGAFQVQGALGLAGTHPDSTGDWVIEPGGVLTLGPGDHPLAAGADISGGGTLVIERVRNDYVPRGNLGHDDVARPQERHADRRGGRQVNNLDWRDGAQSGTGTTTVLSGGTVALSGAKTLSCLLRLDRALDLTAVPGSLSVCSRRCA